MNKKGGAFMEFMLTYGWAIIVVAIAVVVLVWTGALSKDKLMPTNASIVEYNHPTYVYMLYGQPGNCMCQVPDLNQTFLCDEKPETQQRCNAVWRIDGWWVDDIDQMKAPSLKKISAIITEIEYIQSHYETEHMPLEKILDLKNRANRIKVKIGDANSARQLNATLVDVNILLSDIQDIVNNAPALKTNADFIKVKVE